MSRWNQWVEEQDGEGMATLAGTLVGKPSCHVQGYQYQVHEGTEGLDLECRQPGGREPEYGPADLSGGVGPLD